MQSSSSTYSSFDDVLSLRPSRERPLPSWFPAPLTEMQQMRSGALLSSRSWSLGTIAKCVLTGNAESDNDEISPEAVTRLTLLHVRVRTEGGGDGPDSVRYNG